MITSIKINGIKIQNAKNARKEMARHGKCESNRTISRQIIQDGFADTHAHLDALRSSGRSDLGDAERSNVRSPGGGKGISGVRIHGAL